MRAILIDPYDQTVTEIVVDGNNLQEIYKTLQVTCIDAVRLENGDVIYVDDEGLLKSPTHLFDVAGIDVTAFAGRGLLVGSTGDGYDADPKHSINEVRQRVGFLIAMRTKNGNTLFRVPYADGGRVQ